MLPTASLLGDLCSVCFHTLSIAGALAPQQETEGGVGERLHRPGARPKWG